MSTAYNFRYKLCHGEFDVELGNVDDGRELDITRVVMLDEGVEQGSVELVREDNILVGVRQAK
jgi:hypothetical protein